MKRMSMLSMRRESLSCVCASCSLLASGTDTRYRIPPRAVPDSAIRTADHLRSLLLEGTDDGGRAKTE